jgi:hypothetical protein
MSVERAQPPEPAQLFGSQGDRCTNCHAPLAVDQRYCVHCGTRRGKSRFSLNEVAAQAAPAPPAPPPTPRHHRRVPSGVTLVTGVATLLLAMGVGVLIGHDSNSPAPVKQSQPYVIQAGGSTTPTSTSTTPLNTKGKATAGTSSYSKKQAAAIQKQIGVKPTTVKVTAQSKAAAQQAATKVFGQKSKLVKNPTQKVGSSCSGGAGCQNGKFTGNFFP